MSFEDNFDDLPNILKNIESQIQSINKLSNKNKFDDNTNKNPINAIKIMHCNDNITQVENTLSENKKNLNKIMSKSKEEISKNFENFIKKIEEDTNEHIKNIENLKLTEEEKKEEYIKCIEQLDNILSMSESMRDCIEISEENFLNFISKTTSFNSEPITSFLKDKENDLNKNNIYNTLNDTQNNSEKIFNNLKSANVRSYIINSNINELKLNKLKINEFSDFPNIKQILFNTNDKDEFIQNQIKKISINNLSKKDFEYIFNKNIKLKKKDHKNSNSILPKNSESNLLNDLERHKRTQTLPNIFEKDKALDRKLSNNDVSKIIESEFEVIDDNSNQDKKNYLKIEFNYPNIYIKKSDLMDIKLNELFENVNTLKISSCKLAFEFYNIFDNESFNKMSELYLENCNIVNENFLEIIYSIIKNNNLRNNLKCLSFKKNNLSCLYFYKYILDGKIIDSRFENLDMLDLSYNNLNIIDNKSISGLPNIKVIDLSNNNLQFPQDFNTLYEKYDKLLKRKNTIREDNKAAPTTTSNLNEGLFFQIANNTGLLKGNHINTYIKYLIEALPKLNYPLKSINMSGLFYKSSCHNLITSINLNKFQRSLIELDLSFCNITDNEISNLLLNEFRLINIKKINLSNNKLTDELFSLLINNKSYDIYNQLKIIDLSNNNIRLSNKNINIFVKSFDSLKIIIIKNTPAEENINNYIKKIIKRFNEKQNKDKNITELNDLDLLIKGLIENKEDKENYLINNSHIKLKMKNTVDYKFIEAAEKIYPDLFERIKIEYKKLMPN